MFRNEHKPFDNRPIGLNNPTRMVEHYFSHNAFDVIQQVHYNLGLLQTLSNNMTLLNSVGSNLFDLKGIQKYLGDIVTVAHNLNNIITVHNELPILQDLAPRIKEFTSQLECYNAKSASFEKDYEQRIQELTSKTKYIEDLYIQYECGLKHIVEEQMERLTVSANKYLQEFEKTNECVLDKLNHFNDVQYSVVNKAVQNHNKIEAKLAHLEASDAVTQWVFSQDDKAYGIALKAIKNSEEYENDETMNRKRLKYEQQNDVLKLIKNSSEVKVEDGCSFGGCNG